jgi:signal transduction histidine kinase
VAAESIVSNSSASVAQLASARTQLRRLEILLDDYIDHVAATGESSAATVDEIRLAHLALSQTWMRYNELPTYPGEKELWPHIQVLLSSLSDSIDAALARLPDHNAVAAEGILTQRIKPTVDRLDDDLMKLGAFNAERGSQLAARVGVLRRRSVRLAFGLDGMSALLAIIAATLATRLVRGDARLVRRRAAELENFAGRVSHDLRAPLGTISLTLDLLARKHDTETESIVQKGSRSVKRMTEVIDAMLVFARAGARPESGARANVKEVVDAVIDEVRSLAAECRVEVRSEEMGGIEVACRPGILSSAVSNLVENAIKHMADAPVRRVVISAEERRVSATIHVEDTGPGVASDVRDTLFEPYVRSADPSVGGIGLGLATVKRLSEAHGGRVGVESRAGRGSKFWIELPKAPQPSAQTQD